MPLLWTSGDICPGFQSLAWVLRCLHAMDSSDSPLVWDLLGYLWLTWQLSLLYPRTCARKLMGLEPRIECAAQCALEPPQPLWNSWVCPLYLATENNQSHSRMVWRQNARCHGNSSHNEDNHQCTDTTVVVRELMFIYISAKRKWCRFRWVRGKCYWGFTFGSHKDRRKKCFRFRFNITESSKRVRPKW